NVIGVLGILQHVVRGRGSGFEGVEVEPLLLSTDPNFRPVALQFGLDGALYVCDWHNALIGHMQHSVRDPNRDTTHGRIWRVTYPSRPLPELPKIESASISSLLDLLKEPAYRVRAAVRRELWSRDPVQVGNAMRNWRKAQDPSDPGFAHHAMEVHWVQTRLRQTDRDLWEELLKSPDARGRAAAVRSISNLGAGNSWSREWLRQAIRDDHPRVRLEAVLALSFLRDRDAVTTTLQALQAPRDEYLNYALNETLETLRPNWEFDDELLTRDTDASSYLLARLSTSRLEELPAAVRVVIELIGRNDRSITSRLDDLRRLAPARGRSAGHILVNAIEHATRHHNPLEEDTVAGFAEVLRELSTEELQDVQEAGRKLATSDSGAGARRLGFAILLRSDPTSEISPPGAQRNGPWMGDLWRAIPLLPSAEQRLVSGSLLQGLARLSDSASRRAALDVLPELGLSPAEVLATIWPWRKHAELTDAVLAALDRLNPAEVPPDRLQSVLM
ncbi:MAG TPA: HEAT repeat domain-containing protein, partial [Pirellulaceae bacterium]